MKTVLITGANRGIGLEYCRQLNNRGDKVIATCRERSKALESLGVQIENDLDVTSKSAIDNLASNLAGIEIDILINNAGILEIDNINDLDDNNLRKQFEVNALSPLNITRKLLPNLKKGSKVILMTSRMGSIADNRSGSFYGYRMSKAALCIAGKSLSIDLAHIGIAVALLHPGLVRTRMTDFSSNGISTEESVKGLIKRIDYLNINNSGTFWHANGEELPW